MLTMGAPSEPVGIAGFAMMPSSGVIPGAAKVNPTRLLVVDYLTPAMTTA